MFYRLFREPLFLEGYLQIEAEQHCALILIAVLFSLVSAVSRPGFTNVSIGPFEKN